ncbi:MAG: Maltose/maltodextrin ABC transporter, permease protein MalG, partial [uncultured Acetobacteraceae bacterium]
VGDRHFPGLRRRRHPPQDRLPPPRTALGAGQRLRVPGNLRGAVPGPAALHVHHVVQGQRRGGQPPGQPLDDPQPDAGELHRHPGRPDVPALLPEQRGRHRPRGVHHHGGVHARGVRAGADALLGQPSAGDRRVPDLPRAGNVAVHPAVPDRGRPRPAQLDLGAGAGLPDADRALLHLDHDRLLRLHPQGAGRGGADRRRQLDADAHPHLHPRGDARHHRCDDLRLHRVLGGLRLPHGLRHHAGSDAAHHRCRLPARAGGHLRLGADHGRLAAGGAAARGDLCAADGLLHRRADRRRYQGL